jgi:hypothetical protein
MNEIQHTDADMKRGATVWQVLCMVLAMGCVVGWYIAFDCLQNRCDRGAVAGDTPLFLVVPPYALPDGSTRQGQVLNLNEPKGGVYVLGEPYASVPGGALPGPVGADDGG